MVSLDDVVYRLYGAALSVASWSAILDDIAVLLRSRGSMILAKRDNRWVTVLYSPALADAIEVYRDEAWWSRNPWFDPSTEAALRAGDVYRDQDLLTDHQIANNPFYADFLPRVGLGWQMVAMIQSDFGSPTGLLVQRAKEGSPYSKSDLHTLGLVSRHAEQSLRIASHLLRERTGHGAVLDALDTLDRGAFLLDNRGRPLRMNSAAEAMVGQYFQLSDTVFTPAQAHERDAFSSAIMTAAHLTHPAGRTPSTPLMLSGCAGGPPLVIWILPVLGASSDHLSFIMPSARVLVLAQLMTQGQVFDPSVIRSLFGLTFGEAKLAALLAAGMTVKDAAKELNITEGTSRVVLKRIFKKLGINRQAELIASLSMFGRKSPF